jgi:hypothetical protein
MDESDVSEAPGRQFAIFAKEGLLAEVKRKLRRDLIRESIKFVKDSNIELWGRVQPSDFVENMVLGTLYKDLYDISYYQLEQSVQLSYIISQTSWEHNVKKIRKVLRNWAWSESIFFLVN